MKERLREEIRRSQINSQPLSIIMMDIDHFKDYNDRYGHSAGDKVLLGIADIIRNNIKDSYVVARYGGEEFVMIMPSTDINKARLVAEGIRKDISEKQFILRRQQTSVTISAGAVSCSEDIRDEEGLLKKADICLYTAKKEGRNKVCVV
jgi:diguanylate cyclase (GGDEF)-like protein